MKIKINRNFQRCSSTCLQPWIEKKNSCNGKNHVHLHPIDFTYDGLIDLNNGKYINPDLLDDKHLRKDVTGVFDQLMKKVTEISNQNLIRNSDVYIAYGGKIDPDNAFSRVDNSYKQAGETFQLGY